MSKANLVRASRDGDQFHYLWAARRCLQLLSSCSDLVAISIEGPSTKETGDANPIIDGEEVIDVAEYFGSERLDSARIVRYMQLKHSTTRATELWTASGLENTVKGFAKRYKELLKTFQAESLASKLEFWFVTNRPIGRDFVDTVIDVAAGALPRHPAELEKLRKFTSLEGNELASFSKLLHFQGRQDDYWEQRNILSQEVRGYLAGADADGPLQLLELVKRRALSEGEHNPRITKKDVERALNTDESMLFPAPCLINALEEAVPRAQDLCLMGAIYKAGAPIIIHASGGVGKTVFARRIADYLPEGSQAVLYDCYGNGLHRNPTNYRHRHRDALVQIANELASKGLCYPLIPTSSAAPSDYMRAFINRISQAADLVHRSAAPNAILSIVVDAADNAQMAAEEIGEARSFVRDLIRESVPENVRLIFLCRTHRQAYLDPPVDAIPLELKPFEREETASFLRQRFPNASEHDVNEFHRLSSRNPRVQALALSSNVTLLDALRQLGPDTTTVEDSIESLLESAVAKLRDSIGSSEKEQVGSICAGLAALRPLIPIQILAKISGVEEDAIRSFAVDLGRCLLIVGNTIQFFDEPAETWFRRKFKPSAEAIVDFIKSLAPLATTSAYVASVLPPLMLEAGKLSELVELALTSAWLPDTSPLERRDIELQRLQFALKAALRSKRHLDAAKLALKAGGEMAGDDRQRTILQANTDLAAIFLETDIVQQIVSRRILRSGWLGSGHAYEATLLSGRLELIGDARSRLRIAYDWLRHWVKLPQEEREDEEISDEDIVALTLAQINIHGPTEGAQSLRHWSPREEVSYRIGRMVARKLVDHGRFQDLEEFAGAAGNNLYLVLAISVELREVQRTLDSEVTSRALRLIAKKHVNVREGHTCKDQDAVLLAVSALVESSLQHGVCTSEDAVTLLSRYLPSEPPRGLSSRFRKSRFAVLRTYCLRAALQGQILEIGDLAYAALNAEIKRADKHVSSEEAREFQHIIGALLPWHQLWVAVLLGRVTKGMLPDELQRTRQASNSSAQNYYMNISDTSDEIALLWLDILHRLEVQDLTDFKRWKSSLRRPLTTPTLTALARLFSQKDTMKAGALEFAHEAFILTKDRKVDAESKSSSYIDICRSILTADRCEAKEYFNEAVEVASKIGDENLSRWDAILDLAARASRPDRPLPEIAYHFARSAELTYDYVIKDKHFDWRATVKALCDLCPSSAFAILSRWRDRGFGCYSRILPIAIERLVERRILDARDAVPMIGFHSHWSYDQLLDSALRRCATRREKEVVAERIYSYMRFGEENFSSLKKVASQHGIVIADLGEENEASISVERQQIDISAKTLPDPEHPWDDVFTTLDLATANGLAQACRVFKASSAIFHFDRFFSECIRRLPTGSEPAFVEAIGNVPDFGLFHFRTFLEQVPDSWKKRLAIRRALEVTLKVFCRRYCMGITANRYYNELPLTLACKLAGISEAAIIEVALEAIGNAPDLADSSQLFSLVGLLVTKLSEDDATVALQFGLGLFDLSFEDKDGDGPWSTHLMPPADVRASLAGYIWASMAAPEGATRWEGAHAVLGIVALERQDVLAYLMQFATERKGGPFVDARLAFYQLNAVQWFLIGIARAAAQYPAVLTPWWQQICNWAIDDQPHILIRQFAARAGMALVDSGVLANTDNLRERLSKLNVSSLPIVKSQLHNRIRREPETNAASDQDDRFFFGLDLGCYWYAPLGQIFGLSQHEIEMEAFKVIRADFSSTSTGEWSEDERGRRNLYQENHINHSHGSYPRADTLHFYQGYHAMMIAAGKLLQSTSMHCDSEYGAEEDDFARWLDSHDISRRDGRWLWDRRDPTPRKRSDWQTREKDDESRLMITEDDVDEALRSKELLNIWGHWTEVSPKRQQSVYIRSALVSPNNSLALLRALATTRNVYDYIIPEAGSDNEIDQLGFYLKGWISNPSSVQGLDSQDPWAGGINFPPPIPTREIIEFMHLRTDPENRIWQGDKGSIFMTSQVWGHCDETRSFERDETARGSRLQASLNFLTDMLAKLDRKLIIEVQIDRRLQNQPYITGGKGDENEVQKRTRLFLLGSDERFDTI